MPDPRNTIVLINLMRYLTKWTTQYPVLIIGASLRHKFPISGTFPSHRPWLPKKSVYCMRQLSTRRRQANAWNWEGRWVLVSEFVVFGAYSRRECNIRTDPYFVTRYPQELAETEWGRVRYSNSRPCCWIVVGNPQVREANRAQTQDPIRSLRSLFLKLQRKDTLYHSCHCPSVERCGPKDGGRGAQSILRKPK
ncbi:hypothetical protein VTK73DRAFT_9861 [Phialemonium thermophilum]|uniref:Uncharacterized protein n=1 Tax=Phialemonium thermophilum TaxID=223376 RepID=A0ABR3XIG1_9PEZI